MTELLPSLPLLTAFLAASFILAVTPGPGVLYIVTRSIVQGRRAGLASVAGVALGNLGNAIGASLGLAILFAASSFAFAVVKYTGAAYLIYLGVQALRVQTTETSSPTITPDSAAKIFRDGFIVALLNPKTALFFAAFLPQFIGADASPLQSIVLGAFFVSIAAVTDTIYAVAAGFVAPILSRTKGAGSIGRYFSAATFIGLGILTALSSKQR